MSTTNAHNRKWLAAKALIGLLLAYGFASWAVDSGSLWHYFFTLVFLAISVKTLVQLVKK